MISAPSVPKEEPFPFIPEALLKKLDELFPERCAAVTDDITAIRHKSGQRSVVVFLQEKLRQQNEDILKSKPR